MKYVVCNPEDLLEGPNGIRLAPGGIDVYKNPTDAMNIMTSSQYWSEEVYPCDVDADDCKVVGEREISLFVKEPRVILLRPAPVSESKMIRSWITFTQDNESSVGKITALAYAFAAARLPFMVTPCSGGGMSFNCLLKDTKAASAVLSLASNTHIKIGPIFEIAAKPVTLESGFDYLGPSPGHASLLDDSVSGS